MAPEDIRKLGQQHHPPSLSPSRLVSMTDNELVREAVQARAWLFGVLSCHERMFKREHEIRMFRFAVEKELSGRSGEWSEMEKLYMALTDCELVSPEERLKAGLALVLHLNFAECLKDVSERLAVNTDRAQRAAIMDANVDQTRDIIVEKAQSIKVDHFACAVPLAEINKIQPSIIDDNAGCCPICQNSYTALSEFPIHELLSDYPVRIKYCGHIVGKACLEQWMITPKIDEAKYPHRTCPLCRVKIEDVMEPRRPDALLLHLQTDRRAMETVQELVYGWDMELKECLDVIIRAMSEEIAAEQLLALVAKENSESKEHKRFEKEEKFLKGKTEELRKEKWAWGFRGDGVWRKLRDEWMNSVVVAVRSRRLDRVGPAAS